MELIIDESGKVFNMDAIGKGWLVWAKHKSWDEGHGGYVTAALPDRIIVQYHPGIGNIINHFIIKAAEAQEWTIRWSKDLTDVQETGGQDVDEEL